MNQSSTYKPLFPLGRVVITPNAMNALSEADMLNALRRHAGGDWGELCDADVQENELALAESFRLFSAYRSANGVRFWLITEADRSSSCILLPEDY